MNSETVRTAVGVEMGIPAAAHSCEEMCTLVDSVAAGVSGEGMFRGRNTLGVLVEEVKCLTGWGRRMLKTTLMVAAVAGGEAGVDDFHNRGSIATNPLAIVLDPALVSRFGLN